MATRILGIELRRSAAAWVAGVIAAVGVFVLFASNPPFGAWMELVIFQRDIMQLTWPLALAAGAWQGIRDSRSKVDELLGTTPRPRWRRMLPVAAAMAIAIVLAYLVMLAGAAFHLRHALAYFPLGAIPIIALGALGMVAAVWLGLAIGSLLPSPLTAPLLAVAGFFGLALSPMFLSQDSHEDPGTALLMPYLQGPRDGNFALSMLSARANLAQALWLVALAATGLALFGTRKAGHRMAALLPVVLGAGIVLPMAPDTLTSAWIPDLRATETVCTRDQPVVCSARINSYALERVRGPARQALSILATKLPSAPSRVMIVPNKPPEGPASRDTVMVVVDDVDAVSDDALLWLILDGAGVRPCPELAGKGETDRSYATAREVVAAWLLDRDPPSTDDRPRKALAALQALPADEQKARVIAFRDAERACVPGDRLAMLTGTAQ
jgi:hypothetical protein